ncbi:hypothetical protein BN1723_017175, partial [Verticillium longisporum]
MVSNKLSPEDVKARAGELDFPGSVLEFLEGMMGQPFGGFPEPLRSDALRGRRKLDARPGLSLEPVDFVKVKRELGKKFGGPVTETDIASYVMYPKVFEDYKKFVQRFGDLSVLPTKYFLSKPEIGEEFHVELEKGKVLILKLLAVGPLSENTGQPQSMVPKSMVDEPQQATQDRTTEPSKSTPEPIVYSISQHYIHSYHIPQEPAEPQQQPVQVQEPQRRSSEPPQSDQLTPE